MKTRRTEKYTTEHVRYIDTVTCDGRCGTMGEDEFRSVPVGWMTLTKREQADVYKSFHFCTWGCFIGWATACDEEGAGPLCMDDWERSIEQIKEERK